MPNLRIFEVNNSVGCSNTTTDYIETTKTIPGLWEHIRENGALITDEVVIPESSIFRISEVTASNSIERIKKQNTAQKLYYR